MHGLVSHYVSSARTYRRRLNRAETVSRPHKVAITGYLDELTTEGREVGACNTIFVREHQGQRRYIGTNTDVVGIREAFAQNIENVYDVSNAAPRRSLSFQQPN